MILDVDVFVVPPSDDVDVVSEVLDVFVEPLVFVVDFGLVALVTVQK